MPAPRPLFLIVLLLGAFALVALSGCGDSGDDDPTTAQETTTAADTGPCRQVEQPTPKADGSFGKPKFRVDHARAWRAVVTTNCGTFTIGFEVDRAPKTVSSFMWLARKRFFDGLTFHRIAPGFVIQGGDPLGNGTGGSGYTVVEAPPKDLRYTHGVVAMAKTATEPDGASGSQFFIVTGEDAGLPPQYALVGSVTEGLDVVDTIGALPIDSSDPQGSAPVDPVVIESVRIQDS